jgi:hypothetical protein
VVSQVSASEVQAYGSLHFSHSCSRLSTSILPTARPRQTSKKRQNASHERGPPDDFRHALDEALEGDRRIGDH